MKNKTRIVFALSCSVLSANTLMAMEEEVNLRSPALIVRQRLNDQFPAARDLSVKSSLGTFLTLSESELKGTVTEEAAFPATIHSLPETIAVNSDGSISEELPCLPQKDEVLSPVPAITRQTSIGTLDLSNIFSPERGAKPSTTEATSGKENLWAADLELSPLPSPQSDSLSSATAISKSKPQEKKRGRPRKSDATKARKQKTKKVKS
jgi:hypothetical protein